MSMTSDDSTHTVDPGLAAFERTARARAAVNAASVPRYNLEAVHAKGQAYVVARNVEPFRPVLERLVDFDIGHLDHLRDLADALQFVNSTRQSLADYARKVPELADEGFDLRRLLMAYGDVLAIRGIFAPEVLERLRHDGGYADLADDLDTLVKLYRAHPDVMGPGAPVSTAEVDRAAELAHAIAVERGADAAGGLTADELAQERRKIAHLLLQAHAQIRRAMEYLRFEEGDAKTLVPTLYVQGERSGETEVEEPEHAHPHLAEIHDDLHAGLPDDPELNPFVDED